MEVPVPALFCSASGGGEVSPNERDGARRAFRISVGQACERLARGLCENERLVRMNQISIEDQLRKMREDWDRRALENARYYVKTDRQTWSDEAFYETGEQTVAKEILTDMENICQGKAPADMRVLEIGCGTGRVTRALAKLFGEVHAVDVSGEMVRLAAQELREYLNVFLYQNNGKDLAVVPDREFDFAFSWIVFQHIPSREIIENYVREVHRLLRRGALFKFQVQGYSTLETQPDDTWLGVGFTEQQADEMAVRCGFEPRYRYGAGGQYFTLWFFKRSRLGSLRAKLNQAVSRSIGRVVRSFGSSGRGLAP
jgi:ubiquinone/menaquinone biosynthesis C-methylase UbiE